jgi:hypothetical protein
MSSWWQKEPARIIGQIHALLALAAALGFVLNDKTTAAIVAAATAIAAVLSAEVVRSKVTSPATAKTQLAQAGLLSAKLATISTTPFGGNGVAGYGQGFPTDTTLTFTLLGKDDGAQEALTNVAKAAYELGKPKALGRRPAKDTPSLKFADHLVTVPVHPISDPAPNLVWPMDHNDTVGDCVVAGLDHALQAIYATLDGAYTNWSDAEMLTCYQTQNPQFTSWSMAGSSADQGMDIQTFLEYLVAQKIILGFAKVNHTNLEEVKAATYLGLGLVTGETLTSKNMNEAVWDYHQGDPQEGGHCTVTVGYDPLDQQVSWGGLYSMTDAFFQNNVEEAWFVITQAHVDHPGFRAGFDLTSFAAAYKALTGRDFPVVIFVPPSPTPVPPVPPVPSADPFLAVADAKLVAKLVANAKGHKNPDGTPMNLYQYAVWKLDKDFALRG